MRLDEIKSSRKYALNGGPFGSKLVSNDYVPTGVPVIRGTNLSENTYFSMEDLVFVSEEKADELKPNNAHPGDIIFTQRGTLGQVGIIPNDSKYDRFVVSQSQMKLTVDKDKADPYYIYYYFKHPNTIQRIKNLAFSSGVPHINLQVLREFEIDLPPFLTQRKITTILSAYDDLIENNTRRIKILEEMAQALYREWFVHFRFPGHKHMNMVDSPLGMIPEGWVVKKASEIAFINPKTKVPKEGLKPFVMMESLSTDSMVIGNIKTKTGNSGSKFKNQDTLFARITPCLENGKTGFVQFLTSNEDVAVGSTEFIVLRSRMVVPEFVYLMARSQAFRDHAIKSMSGATGRQRVNEACFDNFPIAMPNWVVLQKFHKITSIFFRKIYLLESKNSILRQTRDLLLPKLISGELNVEDLNIKIDTSNP